MKPAGILIVSSLLAGCLVRTIHAAGPDFKDDFLWQLNLVEQRLTSLAQAIPAESYEWRPAKGVRSISEVLLHVAAGNTVALQSLGGTPPPGFSLEKFELKTTAKEAVLEALRRSFEQLRVAAQSTALDHRTQIFGQDTTVQRVLVTTALHQHEHLGQAIAYARSLGVVPPWSGPTNDSPRKAAP